MKITTWTLAQTPLGGWWVSMLLTYSRDGQLVSAAVSSTGAATFKSNTCASLDSTKWNWMDTENISMAMWKDN